MNAPPPPPAATLSERTGATDAALAARLALGDADALDPLYRRHKGPVYRFALLWSGSQATAADVTQDVFMHLLTHAADYDPNRGALPPWLIGIARNFVRRRAGLGETPFDFDDDSAPPPAAIDTRTPEAALVAHTEAEALRRAIVALPPHYREVLVLVELAERSYAETAAICGVELNTVRSRLHRARALLTRWLAIDTPATAPRPNAA
ncbi:MAG: sigma-70 family RNA polymerase sigma factor [Burkholderiales bacterium]